MRHLKVKNILFFSFIFINFIMSVLIKTKLNFNYQPGERKSIIRNSSFNCMVSYSLSLFIICCLRICTMYWNIHKIFW
jgi:hypothetical protein